MFWFYSSICTSRVFGRSRVGGLLCCLAVLFSVWFVLWLALHAFACSVFQQEAPVFFVCLLLFFLGFAGLDWIFLVRCPSSNREGGGTPLFLFSFLFLRYCLLSVLFLRRVLASLELFKNGDSPARLLFLVHLAPDRWHFSRFA